MAEWWNVNKVVKVWSGHANSAQRKGDIYPPAGLKEIDEYKGSVEFNPDDLQFNLDGKFVDDPDPSYPGYWVRLSDLSKDPYEPVPDLDPTPDPDPFQGVTNEEAGAAIRKLVNLVLDEIMGE